MTLAICLVIQVVGITVVNVIYQERLRKQRQKINANLCQGVDALLRGLEMHIATQQELERQKAAKAGE